jgi:hypothetical protein
MLIQRSMFFEKREIRYLFTTIYYLLRSLLSQVFFGKLLLSQVSTCNMMPSNWVFLSHNCKKKTFLFLKFPPPHQVMSWEHETNQCCCSPELRPQAARCTDRVQEPRSVGTHEVNVAHSHSHPPRPPRNLAPSHHTGRPPRAGWKDRSSTRRLLFALSRSGNFGSSASSSVPAIHHPSENSRSQQFERIHLNSPLYTFGRDSLRPRHRTLLGY